MDALSLLEAARSAGMAVSADDGRLVVRGPRSAEEIALQLLDRKDEILPLLRPADPPVFGDDPGPHNSQDSHNSPLGLRERVFEAARLGNFPPIRLLDKRRCRGEDRWRLLLFSAATTDAELVRLLMRLGSPTLDELWDDAAAWDLFHHTNDRIGSALLPRGEPWDTLWWERSEAMRLRDWLRLVRVCAEMVTAAGVQDAAPADDHDADEMPF